MIRPAALLVLLAACASEPLSSSTMSMPRATHACDPLVQAMPAILLGEVLGAGRDAAGTTYLVDRGATGTTAGERAFVSDGSILRRHAITGSGTIGDYASYAASVAADPPFAVKIERAGDVTQRMGIHRGELTEKDFTIGVDSDELVLLGARELAAFTLETLPPSVAVELLAATEDGHRVLVTSPTYDVSYEAFHVYYGSDAAMIEREAEVGRSRGGSTYVTFDLDGASASLVYEWNGGAQLTVGGVTSDLAVAAGYTQAEDARSLTTGLSFQCY